MEANKKERYKRIRVQLQDLFSKNNVLLSRMATINALLYHKFPTFSWVGFYLLENMSLTIGPYQGPLACLTLQLNKGVCWKGINEKVIVNVPDVHEFPGHIACDPATKSEIVIPVLSNEKTVIGVLDIDSKQPGNFDLTDEEELQMIVEMLMQ